ncbi:MAG: glycine cleavage system protein T [Lentisphaerae bacterium GWF2_52_8]|nr:MAG: glycine cleavage system protein T [Lentisphaerae bacterium GWF2_52_8]
MSDASLKSTPLRERHIALGAKMVPFSGWEMPVQYQEGILAEHKQTREQCSLFDICHMGEFRVRGKEAAAALDRSLARAVADQKEGSCRYNFLLDEDGMVLDDLIVYRISAEEFFIVVNAGTRENDAAVFRARLPEEVSFEDESDATAKLDLQGPASASVLEKLGLDIKKLPAYYCWMNTTIAGHPCLLSRTGYTGELGFEIYSSVEAGCALWDTLLSLPGVKPAGLGARDTLRLEMAYPLYGHELNTGTTPVEAGFGGMLKLESGRQFVGSDALRNGTPRKKLVAVEIEGRRAAREGTPLLQNGKLVGKVSSGAFSPSLGFAIALAYVESLGVASQPGDELQLDMGRGAQLRGRFAALPFYKKGSARKAL